MLDWCVLAGIALVAGGFVPIAPFPTVVAVVASAWFLRRLASYGALLGAVLLLFVGALRGRAALADFERARGEVRAALAASKGGVGGPVRCAATGIVSTSPVLMRPASAALAKQPSGEPARAPPTSLVASFGAELSDIDCEGHRLEKGMRARLYGGPSDLARGDRVAIIADLAPAQLFENLGLPDPRPASARRGILASGGAHDVTRLERGVGVFATIDRLRARVRRRIIATFASDAVPMARALVLGESDLDEADNEAFRASGLAHLLAVSGTHLVLVVLGAVRALSALLRRLTFASARWDVGRWSAGFGIVLSWIYADFAGASGSANRAAAMLSFALGARMFGRRPDGPRAFGWSLIGAALVDPLVGFDISFVLSVAATAGLMVLQRPIAARLLGEARHETWFSRSWAGLASALATTLSATIGCAPVLALMAPSLPIGGLLANLVAVPVGELLALPLCLAHVGLGFAPALERGDALAASASLLIVRAVARVTERAQFLALPVPMPTSWQYAAAAASVALVIASPPGRKLAHAIVGAAVVALLELSEVRVGAPRGRLRVTVLDVAQGDSLVVDFPDGRAMLIDGGGMVGSPIDTGRAVVLPLLRARRRAELAVMVLSHPHPDHFGGLAAVAHGTRIHEFWDTGQGEAEGAGPVYAALLADLRLRQVPVVRPDSLCDRPRSFGGATVEVLAPCPSFVPFGNANDNSLILRVSYGVKSALLVGDAEHDEEAWVLEHRRALLHADFLKVGHHGSGTSTSPAFFDAVAPANAAISCGVRNRFGHPHPATLQTLSRTRVLRTDKDGSVEWVTDGRATWVITAREQKLPALFRFLVP